MKLHCRNFILCEFALSDTPLEILTLAQTLGFFFFLTLRVFNITSLFNFQYQLIQPIYDYFTLFVLSPFEFSTLVFLILNINLSDPNLIIISLL